MSLFCYFFIIMYDWEMANNDTINVRVRSENIWLKQMQRELPWNRAETVGHPPRITWKWRDYFRELYTTDPPETDLEAHIKYEHSGNISAISWKVVSQLIWIHMHNECLLNTVLVTWLFMVITWVVTPASQGCISLHFTSLNYLVLTN